MTTEVILTIASTLSMIFGIPAFVLYNRYRIRQMLYHLNLCRGRELTEKEYVDLLDEYTSFLGYASFSPSRRHYPRLYTNPAFAAFTKRSKRVMQCLAGVLAVGILLNMLA